MAACGLPYTIAAQIAHPNRQCVAFVGDGGFSMLMAEFAEPLARGQPNRIQIALTALSNQVRELI